MVGCNSKEVTKSRIWPAIRAIAHRSEGAFTPKTWIQQTVHQQVLGITIGESTLSELEGIGRHCGLPQEEQS